MIIKILMFPVVLLLILYFAIAQIVPTYQSIAAEKTNKEQSEKSLLEAKNRLNQVNEFISGVESHSTEKDFTLKFVPDDQKEEVLINDISQIATNSGINLFSIGFADGGGTKKVAGHAANLIEGRMIVSGTYESFQKFFDQMFRLDRLYTFKTIDLVKAEQKNGDEDTADLPQTLNGTVAFAYSYVPGKATLDPTVFTQDIDYNLIDSVMNAIAPANPLVAEPQNRNNPFLP